MNAKEKLVEELNLKLRNNLSDFRIEEIAEFILADRKRIVEPLVKFNNNMELGITREHFEQDVMVAMRAIKETLNNAGMVKPTEGK